MANEARIRAYMLPVLTLSAGYDPGTDTTISAPELASWPVVGSTNHLAVWINREGAGGGAPYLRYLTAHSTGATTATIGAAAENIVTPYAVSAGVSAHHGRTTRDDPKAETKFRRSTSLSITSTSWASPDTGIDIVLPAYAGDIVEVAASWIWGNEAVIGCADIVSIVSGSPVNTWAENAGANASYTGIQGLRGEASVYGPSGGGSSRALASGDISSSAVTLRLRARILSAGTKTIYALAGTALSWRAVNHGPAYEVATF